MPVVWLTTELCWSIDLASNTATRDHVMGAKTSATGSPRPGVSRPPGSHVTEHTDPGHPSFSHPPPFCTQPALPTMFNSREVSP